MELECGFYKCTLIFLLYCIIDDDHFQQISQAVEMWREIIFDEVLKDLVTIKARKV